MEKANIGDLCVVFIKRRRRYVAGEVTAINGDGLATSFKPFLATRPVQIPEGYHRAFYEAVDMVPFRTIRREVAAYGTDEFRELDDARDFFRPFVVNPPKRAS